MITGKCHCGNVEIKIRKLPESVTSCNCSICFRLGALWAHDLEIEKISFKEKPTSIYMWGDMYVEFHSCPNCGCTTHYKTTEKCEEQKTVVNGRIIDYKIMEPVKIRKFDGADTWKFID